jgi:hypothetical protein
VEQLLADARKRLVVLLGLYVAVCALTLLQLAAEPTSDRPIRDHVAAAMAR